MFASLPLLFLFTITLMTGTMMTLSSNNWLMLWVGLELNLMSFLPLVMMSPSQQEVEGLIKYFLPQALGSGILLMSSFLMMSNHYFMPHFATNLLIIALLIKAGMAPVHFWYPSVMTCMTWPMCIILSSWQKLSPLLLIFFLSNNNISTIIYAATASSALVGGLGGLNQTALRPIMAYSSINHMGWMVASSMFNSTISIMYLTIYIIMSVTIMLMFNMINMYSVNQMLTPIMSPISFFMTSMLIFSLSGLPPLIGFLPKWMVIQTLTLYMNSTLILILILGSLISLYFYLSMTFALLLNFTTNLTTNKANTTTLLLSAMILTITICPMFIM